MKRMMIYTRQRIRINNCVVDFLKNNSSLLLLTSINLSGFIIGNILIATESIRNININYCNTTEVFLWNILISLIILTVTFCSGLCGVGMIFIYILQMLIGIICGIVSASVLFENDFSGLINYIIIYLPSLTLITILEISSSFIALNLSNNIACHIFLGPNFRIDIQKYILKFFYLLIFGIMSSGISVVIYVIFSRFNL